MSAMLHPVQRVFIATLLLMTVGCGETIEKRIQIVRVMPLADEFCGAPSDGQNMTVRALGDFGASESTAQFVALGADEQFDISRFPSETRMLEVEVRGTGGELRAVGRSASFQISELAEDAEIPVFMAPLNGVCPTGPSLRPRQKTKLVRAGNSVLSIGGLDSEGNPSSAVERYNPSSGAFEALSTPLYGDIGTLGLLGASVSASSDGQVAVIGGSATAYQVYSPKLGEFGAPAFYREARGHHAAIELLDKRVFLAAGCSQVTLSGCSPGSALLTTSLLDLSTGEIEDGPLLSLVRIGGQAWIEGDGTILLVGGVDLQGDPVLSAERVFLDGSASQQIEEISGPSVRLSSGAIWAGMALASAPELAVLPPGASTPSSDVSTAVDDRETVLVALDNGSILAIGRDKVQRVRGLDGDATTLSVPLLASLQGHSAIALEDGSVLVVGIPNIPGVANAFVFRPELTGPFSSSVSVSFASSERSEGLSARNPKQVEIPQDGGPRLTLTVGQSGEEWLTVSGPRFDDLEMEVTAATDAGLALYFGWQSPDDNWKVLLKGGTDPVLVRILPGDERTISGCSSSPLEASALQSEDGVHDISLRWRSRTLAVLLDGNTILSCTVDQQYSRGESGVGIEGSSGQSLRIDFISVER